MPAGNVDARLLEMLNATRQNEAPAPAGDTRPEAPSVIREQQDAWAREHPESCTGRGPTGRLRNFRAMNAGKLVTTYSAIRAELNDPEALVAVEAEMNARGLDFS